MFVSGLLILSLNGEDCDRRGVLEDRFVGRIHRVDDVVLLIVEEDVLDCFVRNSIILLLALLALLLALVSDLP